MRTLLISLLLLTVPGGLSAEEARGFFLHLGSGLLASFDQSSGRSPTLEIGLWKPLAAGNSHTTGIHLVHGFAEAKVGPNNLIAPGETAILHTHLLVGHSFEWTGPWTGLLEYGISIIGFDDTDTSLSLAGLGFGAGVGRSVWKDWLLTCRTRLVVVDQSYRGERILHRQLACLVALAVPLRWPFTAR